MSKAWKGGSDSRWRRFRATLMAQWQAAGRNRCEIQGPRCTGAVEQPDHIQPLAQGGAKYDPTNLRPACAVCNRGRRTPTTPDPPNKTITKW